MLNALVFDFDGLIADTETAEFETWTQEFLFHGVTLALDEWIKCVGAGPGVWDVFDHLQFLVGGGLDRDEVLSRRHKRFIDIRDQIRVMPGVVDLLDEARTSSLPVAVASSSTSDWVGGFLTDFGLMDRFETIVTRDQVALAKPAPDLYIEACRRLGVAPATALALEDSTNGVTAARAAGMPCLAVPNSITKGFDFSHATAKVASIEEVCLEYLLGLMDGAN